MTVSSSVRKAGPYVGTGTTGPFSFSFKVFEDSDLLVVKLNASTYIETTLTLTTDYTVSLNADQNANPGGTITLTSALATGYKLVISSQVPYLQETDLTNQGGFYPEVITDALDKLTIEVQQLVETQGRQLTFPLTDPSTLTGQLPSSAARANQYLAFDSNGNPVAQLNIPTYIYQGPYATDPTIRTDGNPLQVGDLYYNTGTTRMRVYTGSVWVDVGVPTPITITTQTFSGDASTTAFTLSTTPAFSAALDVYISGVSQRLTTDYTVSGTTLTFVSAPPSGTDNIYVKIYSAYAGGVPNDGSVTNAKLAFDGGPLGYRNRLINGAMVFDQRQNGGVVTNAANIAYVLDRWLYNASQASKFTIQQNAGGVTPPTGFTNYLGVTSTSSYSIGSTDTFTISQFIEGSNVSDLAFGTASASSITVSFWVRSSKTGSFGLIVRNSALNRNYGTLYTINAANTWEYKSVTIPGDTTGTWLTDNGIGLRLSFNIGAGSSTKVTANAWTAGTYSGVSGQTDIVNTNGATLYITGVQLEKGTTATSFDCRSIGTELALCQRYYTRFLIKQYMYSNAGDAWFNTYVFPQTMRASPTFVASGAWTVINVASSTHTSTTDSYTLSITPNTAGMCGMVAGNATVTLSAEL